MKSYQLQPEEEDSLLKLVSLLFEEYSTVHLIRRKVNSESFQTFIQFSLVKQRGEEKPVIIYRDTVHWLEVCTIHIPTRLNELRSRYSVTEGDSGIVLARTVVTMFFTSQNTIEHLIKQLYRAYLEIKAHDKQQQERKLLPAGL